MSAAPKLTDQEDFVTYSPGSETIEQELRRYEEGLKGKRLKVFKAAFQKHRESNGVRAAFMLARLAVEGE